MALSSDEQSIEIIEWAKDLVAVPLTEEVAAALIEIVRSRQDDRAEMAAWALGFGELAPASLTGVVEALCSVIGDTARPVQVRAQAAEAVAQQLEDCAGHRLRPVATDLLIEMLSDASAAVRFWSAFGLGKLRAAAAVPALRSLVDDETPLTGWWTVGEEAIDAIDTIEGRTPPERARA